MMNKYDYAPRALSMTSNALSNSTLNSSLSNISFFPTPIVVFLSFDMYVWIVLRDGMIDSSFGYCFIKAL